MEALSTNSTSAMDLDASGQTTSSEDSSVNSAAGNEKPKSKSYHAQIKQIKPLLSGASRLGRALAELFGLLVKVLFHLVIFYIYMHSFILFNHSCQFFNTVQSPKSGILQTSAILDFQNVLNFGTSTFSS